MLGLSSHGPDQCETTTTSNIDINIRKHVCKQEASSFLETGKQQKKALKFHSYLSARCFFSTGLPLFHYQEVKIRLFLQLRVQLFSSITSIYLKRVRNMYGTHLCEYSASLTGQTRKSCSKGPGETVNIVADFNFG